MRPTPGPMNRHGRHIGSDTMTTLTAPLTCFITTEDALDASSETSFDLRSRPYSAYRKHSPEPTTSRSHQSQISSPTLTGASIASLSSSGLDFEMDFGSIHDLSHVAATTPADLSSMSIISGTSSPLSSPRQGARPFTPTSDGDSRRDCAPQLIMPSLAVPERRPFSESGKSIGKLKVLLVGQPGIGKATLIQSISQCCENIVHIDSVSPSSTGVMNEIYASTRPQPWWRAELDIEDPKRRSSSGEMLDRNLCFVVRSAFQRPSSTMSYERDYVDRQLQSLVTKSMEDMDLWNLLSGGGGPNVDAVLYMIPHTGLKPADIECIRALGKKTNVIPLLARTDELEEDDIAPTKDRIRQQIRHNHLDCFSFTRPTRDTATGGPDLFAVSSAAKTDYDVMDASTLMSSGYVQPLIATDLDNLVHRMFSAEGGAWLRCSAATKCVRWRGEQAQMNQMNNNWALTTRDPTKSALSPVLTTNPFGQRQDWCRIEMSNWAQGLRRSLEAEQFQHVMQQRMAAEASLRDVSRGLVRQMDKKSKKHGRQRKEQHQHQKEHNPVPPNLVHQDPLGLLDVVSRVRRNAKLTVELMSSVGMMAGIAAWIVGPEWARHRGL